MMKEIDKIAKDILAQKIKLEKEGCKPRVVLVNEEVFQLLDNDWIGSIQDLPWGDTLVYEVEKEKNRNVFLADGTIFDLWVVRVNTINDIKVF